MTTMAPNKVLVKLGHDCVEFCVYDGPTFFAETQSEYGSVMLQLFEFFGADDTVPVFFHYSSSIDNAAKHTEDEKVLELCKWIIKRKEANE